MFLRLSFFLFWFQKSFYAKVRSKKKKKAKLVQEDLVSKHSGVLGLCAFVNAFPYDVPDILPDILMVLSDHLHDPQPIPVRFDHFTNCHGQSNWRYRPQNVCNVT